MCKADGSPSEEVGQARKGQQPGEDGASVASLVDISKAAKEKHKDQDHPRSTLLVDFRTPSWTHSLLAESLDCSRGGERAGVCDGNNAQCDDRIENRWQGLDPSKLER